MRRSLDNPYLSTLRRTRCLLRRVLAHARLRPRLRTCSSQGALFVWGVAVLSGIVAFFLNLSNFIVTKKTSAVTLQVLGNVKVVISIGVSLLIFGNAVSSFSVAGCVITLAGVYAYNKAPKA